MEENPRLEALRRRVENDPASIAFAQLAEEYRRAGDFQRAVDCCRAGLAIHPSYVSARVTLGRALVQLGRFEEAQHELEAVLAIAPDNVAAARGLAEIREKGGGGVEVREQPSTMAGIQPQAEIARTLRTIARLEQWLAAIHVARANSRP